SECGHRSPLLAIFPAFWASEHATSYSRSLTSGTATLLATPRMNEQRDIRVLLSDTAGNGDRELTLKRAFCLEVSRNRLAAERCNQSNCEVGDQESPPEKDSSIRCRFVASGAS